MNDQSFIDAILGIEARGWEIVAVYHSHPAGARTDPSPTDIRNANYPEALNLIVSFDRARRPTVRVFQILDGRVHEVSLEIVEGAA
jgi:proteasome lid subunit RPN8/RPN11